MDQKDMWALPPIEKIYEAFSAVADGRVKTADGCAYVSSSDNKKEYTVEWNEGVYSSNDNASYWQGYMGYPLIAVLMMQGKLKYDKTVQCCFKSIKWKELNTKYKNDYAKAADVILDRLDADGIDIEHIKEEADNIRGQLKCLDLRRRRGPAPPKNKG
jgi:hypothetical protein